MECTTGAKILNDGTLVVFKNKDFKVKSHSDKLSFEKSHAFGVRGVNLRIQKPIGFSIGVNQHGLVAVNSNILATTDSPYDLLTERIVLEAKTANEAVTIFEKEIQRNVDYQWCNMVVATPEELVALELTSSEFAVHQSDDFIVRTNHHLILKTNEAIIKANQDKDIQNIKHSKIRYNDTVRILKEASNVGDILSHLRSHHKAAICRHGLSSFQDLSYTTVYSYFVVVNLKNSQKIEFNVVKGPPCQSSFNEFNLEFPLTTKKNEEIRQFYPV